MECSIFLVQFFLLFLSLSEIRNNRLTFWKLKVKCIDNLKTSCVSFLVSYVHLNLWGNFGLIYTLKNNVSLESKLIRTLGALLYCFTHKCFLCTLEFYERICSLHFLSLSSSISCEEMKDCSFLQLLFKIHASVLAVSWACLLETELFKRETQALIQLALVWILTVSNMNLVTSGQFLNVMTVQGSMTVNVYV